MGEWVSVKERLPEKSGGCLVTYLLTGDGREVQKIGISYWASAARTFSYPTDRCQCYTVTHWMPLPDPPEPELKPCPFCGSNNTRIAIYPPNGKYRVICDHCNANGPTDYRMATAIICWNTPRFEKKI